MNPELLRNLWLEITPQRLAAMPAVLGLVFAAFWLTEGRSSVPGNAQWIGLAIGIVWGARQAAGAVAGEIADRTWDSQRASALTPWQMTWGKLVGATAYAWYGVALCAAVHVATGGTVLGAIEVLLATLLAHAVALFASLVLVALGGRAVILTSLPHLAGMVAGLVAGAIPLSALGVMIDGLGWYGLGDGARFRLASVAAFAVWAVLGAWRLMMRELTVPQRPWAWPAFVLFCAGYAAGFAWHDGVEACLRAGFVAAAPLVTAAALAEPKPRAPLQRFLRGAVGEAPASIQALAITATLALALAIATRPAGALPELSGAMPVAAVLFLARDIALIRLVSLGRSGIRGAVAALIWLAVLYLALPGLLGGIDGDAALFLFLPVPAVAAPFGAVALAAPALQAASLWHLLVRRLGTVPASDAAMARRG